MSAMSEIFSALSFFGSITVILFGCLYVILIPYESFQLELQMLKSFYSVSEHEAGSKINKDESDIRLSMAEMLSHRKQYEYSFCEHLLTRFACCCRKKCKNLRQQRTLHNESVERLMRELDIVSFVRDQRLSSFAHKLTMNGH
jgi:hypothetical protein